VERAEYSGIGRRGLRSTPRIWRFYPPAQPYINGRHPYHVPPASPPRPGATTLGHSQVHWCRPHARSGHRSGQSEPHGGKGGDSGPPPARRVAPSGGPINIGEWRAPSTKKRCVGGHFWHPNFSTHKPGDIHAPGHIRRESRGSLKRLS
jgi:hypothetical protein